MKISSQLSIQIMQHFSQKICWSYHQAFVLQGMYQIALRDKNEPLVSWIESEFDQLIMEDGEIAGYKKTEYNLDNIYPGNLLLILYHKTQKEKYKKAILTLYSQLKSQPRNRSGGFWHKKIYPWQMWLNGFYMYGPFYAHYALEFGTKEDFENILQQLYLIESHFKDKKTSLLYQAWDESRKQLWVENENGCSPTIFARSMGWYCMALIDLLDIIPDDKDHKNLYFALLNAAQSLIDPILIFQNENDGMWFQVMDKPGHKGNYTETSASAMFVYFLYKMLRKQYCADSDHKIFEAARNGYKGICSKLSVDENGLFHINGVCKKSGLGRNPYRDGSYKYYIEEPVISDDDKGIGAFLLASLEHEAAAEQ